MGSGPNQKVAITGYRLLLASELRIAHKYAHVLLPKLERLAE